MMEPYVSNDEPLPEGDSKKKKKKKKSKDGTSSKNLEMTSTGKKPKSAKKPKSERKPKSEKKKKPKKSGKAEDMHPTTYAKSVAVASGWEPLNAREINEKHALGGHDDRGFQYAITGHESQVVTVSIPPGETCLGEPGSMLYLTDDVGMKATCGEGGCKRCLGGESCCLLEFTNISSTERGFAGLVAPDPLAKVVPVDLGDPSVNGSLIVQSGTYMASYGDVRITFSCDFNFCRCLCGGMGLVRQKLAGTGTAFLGATGTIVQKVLGEGEIMLCDTNCLLAYAESCEFDIKRTGGIVGMIGGGEGIFNASVKGPGLVVVQSMNMSLLLQSIAADPMYRR